MGLKKILSAILPSIALLSCSDKKSNSPEFHLKVKTYGSFSWCIVFTNDNWITEEPIMQTWDATYFNEVQIVYQLGLWNSRESAVRESKQFSSYQKCVDHNKRIYQRYLQLKEYRKTNPPDTKEVQIY